MKGSQHLSRFSSASRHITGETLLRLTSVGIDIGSSTSLLVFSELELELRGSRYVPVRRSILRESDILLTPYLNGTSIDADALGRFIAEQYDTAGLRREDVDTGVLILTGVALHRENARAIGELFASEAGHFVTVSAGHNLEATMAAYGSGAVVISARDQSTVLNVDIGGGTTKLALCAQGDLRGVGAIDVGARLVTVDQGGVVVRLEPSGWEIGQALGIELKVGGRVSASDLQRMASCMAKRIAEAINLTPMTEGARALWLTPPLPLGLPVDALTFSGGVSEFIYNNHDNSFGDLGPALASEVLKRVQGSGIPMLTSARGIRATVIGASQYTVQVSGDTVFISPENTVPLRNVPVIAPRLSLAAPDIDPSQVGAAVEQSLRLLDLDNSKGPVAVAFQWEGLPTFGRLDGLCRGILTGLQERVHGGSPLVLVLDRDVGGLLGIHLREEIGLENPIISVDGVDLREFDFIDIGSLITTSGAVPVVVKSLVFPQVSTNPPGQAN